MPLKLLQMQFVSRDRHRIIFSNKFCNLFMFLVVARFFLNFKRSALLMNSIKICDFRSIKNCAAFHYFKIEKPIAAKFHIFPKLNNFLANLGRLAKNYTADIWNNIFYSHSMRNKISRCNSKTFCPVEFF